ncbi:hypothetical protein KLP28_03960 [Nocardioidaceae bacterium]|nr:hypothetical protein KLP28_03960 [Nocardioidaceae bacterium]
MTTQRPAARWADPTRCPDCRAALEGRPACRACGLALDGPEAQRLFSLLSEADDVLAELRARSSASRDPAPETVTAPAPAPAGRPRPERGSRLPSATVPLVLLTVGALLLAVAVLLFAAFTWFLLPEIGRALLLLVIALGIGSGAWAASRRRLRIAAEALWPLSLFVSLVGLLLLGPGTGRAEAAWALGAGLALAGAAVAVAQALHRRDLAVPTLLEVSTLVLGAVAAAALTGLDPDLPLLGSGAALPVLLLALGLSVVGVRSRLRVTAAGASAATVAAWAAIVVVGLTTVVDGGYAAWQPVRYADVIVAFLLAAGVAYAPFTRLPGKAIGWAQAAGAGAAAVLLVLAGAAATTGYSRATLSPEPHLNAAALVGGALLLLIATLGSPAVDFSDVDGPVRRRAQGLLAAYALLAVGAVVLVGLATAQTLVVAGERRGPLSADAPGLPTGSVTDWWWAAPVLLAVVAATLPRIAEASPAPGLHRGVRAARPVTPAVLLVVTAACAVAPQAPLWTVVATLAAAVLAAAAAAYASPGPTAVVVLAGSAALLVKTSVPSAPLLVVSLTLVTLVAGTMAFRLPPPGRTAPAPGGTLAQLDPPLAVGAVAAAVATGAGAWALMTGLPGLDLPPLAGALAVVVAVGAWVVTLGLLRRPLPHRQAAGAAALLAVVAQLEGRSAADSTWILLVAGILAVLVTVTAPDDGTPAWVGSALLLGASAARSIAGGPPPEVVSLGAGAVLLALGAWQLRRRPGTSSRRALAPALTLTLTPTLLLSLTEPLGTRTLLVVALGVAALTWGALGGLSAPLLTGGAALLVVGVRMLGPVSSVVPWWIVAGGVGAALLLVGATWESRRAEIDAARRYVRRLR